MPLTTLSVTSLSQVLPGYKHNKPTHSWQFLKISTTSPFLLHLQPFNKFVYCFTREDETKDCFYANVPPRAPQLVVHWENQITIWFSSTPTLHPLFSCNLMDFEEVVLGGWRKSAGMLWGLALWATRTWHYCHDWMCDRLCNLLCEDYHLHKDSEALPPRRNPVLPVTHKSCWRQRREPSVRETGIFRWLFKNSWKNNRREPGGVQKNALKQTPAEQCDRCVVRDEKDQRLYGKGGRFMVVWTEPMKFTYIQQVQFKSTLSMLLPCFHQYRPHAPPIPTASLLHLIMSPRTSVIDHQHLLPHQGTLRLTNDYWTVLNYIFFWK